MNVREIVDRVCKKHKTRNPYELADFLGITVHYCELGSIRGYCISKSRIKQIFINSSVDEHIRRFVLSHELGHAVMHPEQNTLFLKTTFWSVDRYEREANKFAVELTIPDEILMEHWEYSIDEWSMVYGLPREIIELKFK